MKNTKIKLTSQSKIVNPCSIFILNVLQRCVHKVGEVCKLSSAFVHCNISGSNITKYLGINTVAKYMNHQNIAKTIGKSFPTVWYNATRFGINQILMAIILSSLSGINRICRIAAFSGDGVVKALLKLDKANRILLGANSKVNLFTIDE
jgi:hypothetical protein